jgi:hypothetical protein
MKADAAGIHAGPGMTGTPLAYGFFNMDGVRQVGSNNLNCTWNSNPGFSRYDCSITGVSYLYSQFVTIVTPSGGLAIPEVNSASGSLVIFFYNVAGTKIQPPAGFAVTVFKP